MASLRMLLRILVKNLKLAIDILANSSFAANLAGRHLLSHGKQRQGSCFLNVGASRKFKSKVMLQTEKIVKGGHGTLILQSYPHAALGKAGTRRFRNKF